MEVREPKHPGRIVREQVIPKGMSVKEAAKLLGIGRPALSNFLNGKAGLSPGMAVRLEKAFGADGKQLLKIQADFDREAQRVGNKDVAVRAFVPKFLTIKASQIENWARDHIEARNRLAVLLRKLVHSTGNELVYVDFPGFDNAERKGSDGLVSAGASTPWVPQGTSYWEFGTNSNPKAKAEKDYSARLSSVDSSERTKSTFIFVTPRNWEGKADWEKQKNALRDWKNVRVFDASDIEQWLEQSVPAQIWLSEQLALPTMGYETLEHAWLRWANASEPRLTPEIFASSIAATKSRLKAWLEKPSDKPFVVAADSRDEALAFLACLLGAEEFSEERDQAAIFTDAAALRTLIASSVPFIPIVCSTETERELADAYRSLHCITYRPRNAVDVNADISLDLLNYESFEKALVAMGVDKGSIERLARISGCSPTILRRRLSKNAAIATPPWASDDQLAKALIPMALVGVWHAESEGDQAILSCISDQKFEAIEDQLARLLQLDDSPVWRVGSYRGVTSKIDALFAIARMVTLNDLERFFFTAEYVLSEADPALELPEKDRWAAALYGKKRDHSGALREGICETLVILSVHGGSLFKTLGVDLEVRVARLIRKLLTPLTLKKVLSNRRDLPYFAEASPDEFLSILEEDLRSDDPILFGLLKPVDTDAVWASPSRVGLLWALESLAWTPRYLTRVSIILAKFSQRKIEDNWVNKPEASLHSIFRSWMPQTAAPVEQRTKALELLAERFPEVAWRICVAQIKPGSQIGSHSNKPRWRSDASGAGEVVDKKQHYDFNRKALDLMLNWRSHDEKTLGDLVECLQSMPEDDQQKVWRLLNDWTGNASENAKAILRERVRRFAFTRWGRRNVGGSVRDEARKAYDSLRPSDAVICYGWLFADHWVEESIEEIEEDLDLKKREEKIDRLRSEAIAEIWAGRGFDGVKELLRNSAAPNVIGHYAASCSESPSSFLNACLSLQGDLRMKGQRCLQGFLQAMGDESREELLRSAAAKLPGSEQTRLFSCAPFQGSTWRLLDSYSEEVRSNYWKEVFPSWGRYSPSELSELIDRLLEAKRPRAAFHAVHMNFKDVETPRLKRLLREVATVNTEPSGEFRLEPYYISEGLKLLNGRGDVTREEMAQLEFLFIDALDASDHGIPNLESQIAESPSLYIQVVALAYKRSDKGEDPAEWQIENPGQRVAVGTAAHRLLSRIRKIPGTDEKGKIDAAALSSWLQEVRRLSREFGRSEIADECLGELLARAPGGEDGGWPSNSVCEALEAIASPNIGRGFQIGTFNSRGAVWRGKGGDQERELAAKYRSWAERVHFDYPYVGALLEGIAADYEREARWHDSEAQIRDRLRQ